jgi:hypothetical protein
MMCETDFSNSAALFVFFPFFIIFSSFSKDGYNLLIKPYTNHYKIYMIHMSSSAERLLSLSFLKKDGVKPVIFLNWFERCATLL